jgi:hypothetical protein
MAGQPAPILSFREKYLDVTQDEDNGDMQGLLAFFDLMAAPAGDHNILRTACSNESDTSTHAYAILQQDPAFPGSVGRITVLHGVKIFPTRVGVPTT